MDVESNTLDIIDANKQAIFRTNVRAQQGDMVIRTVEMIAFYTGQGFSLGGGGDDASKNASELTRVDCKDKVLITSKDGQTATGDYATFDVKANTVLLIGHVVVSRGQDVAEGPRLKIDLNTGWYRFEVEGETPVSEERPAIVKTAPGVATSSSSAETPTGRSCPPGKQCLLFFPKDAKERVKGEAKKTAPNAAVEEAWKPATSASPVIRND
jgi:lipopolysaccharide export system protein LptA